jgi:hypothetical protein
LAGHLYDFVPGTANPFADPAISFAGIAADLGLGRNWSGGSKRAAITQLLRQTLEQQPGRFCDLILQVVTRGIAYRDGKGRPITREEIDELNGLVAEVGFKIPELHDRDFLKDLARARPTEEEHSGVSPRTQQTLLEHLRKVMSLSPQARGYEFEKFLNALFDAYGLAPRGAFRLVGEQIDGSFQIGQDTYLVEATWRGQKVGAEELGTLAEKVRGKAQWSRGLHISYSSYTKDGLTAFSMGKPTNLICADGLDLHELLQRGLDLGEVVGQKARSAAETNRAFVPVRELFPA